MTRRALLFWFFNIFMLPIVVFIEKKWNFIFLLSSVAYFTQFFFANWLRFATVALKVAHLRVQLINGPFLRPLKFLLSSFRKFGLSIAGFWRVFTSLWNFWQPHRIWLESSDLSHLELGRVAGMLEWKEFPSQCNFWKLWCKWAIKRQYLLIWVKF